MLARWVVNIAFPISDGNETYSRWGPLYEEGPAIVACHFANRYIAILLNTHIGEPKFLRRTFSGRTDLDAARDMFSNRFKSVSLSLTISLKNILQKFVSLTKLFSCSKPLPRSRVILCSFLERGINVLRRCQKLIPYIGERIKILTRCSCILVDSLLRNAKSAMRFKIAC